MNADPTRHAPRHRGRPAAYFAVLVTALTALGTAAWPTSASATAQQTYPATITAQSWYRATPVDTSAITGCGIPVQGCLPVSDVTPPNQYPAGTLHVGVSGGTEDARTYLSLSGTTVPYGAEVTGGSLTLPVDTDTQAGTLSPETASIRACLVRGRVKDGVEGGFYGAPAIDCTTSSAAAFTPSRGKAGPLFTVELAPFAKALTIGEVALALVPGENPGTAWHVAFLRAGQAPTGGGGQAISAQLRTGTDISEVVDVPVSGTVPQDAPPLTAASSELPPVTPGLDAPALPQPAPAVVPDVAVPQSSAPVLATRPVAALRRSIWSPLLFLLPVMLVTAFAWASRVFSRELLPVRD